MKLGGEILKQLFSRAEWRGYYGNELMSFKDIEPLIGPNSIDVTLDNIFLLPQAEGEVDPRDPSTLSWRKEVLEDDSCIILGPMCFMLASVRERFVCDALVDICPLELNGVSYLPTRGKTRKAAFAPMYEGRSTCGRLGIASHITAGFGDYGFGGCFTLELFNHFPYPVKLYPKMRIGQVAFDEVFEPEVYHGAYSGDNHHIGPVPPKLGPDRF